MEKNEKELEKKGHSFFSNSDSEIIPYAFQEWGINFVKKINGMFSITILAKSGCPVFGHKHVNSGISKFIE